MFQLTTLIAPDCFLTLPGEDWKTDHRLLAEYAVRAAPAALQPVLVEQLTPKGHDTGIALGPAGVLFHTRVDALDSILLAVGIRPPMARGPRHPPARLFFAIVIPPARARMYLSFLARLNRWLSQTDTSALLQAGDAAALMASLRAFDAESTVPGGQTSAEPAPGNPEPTGS